MVAFLTKIKEKLKSYYYRHINVRLIIWMYALLILGLNVIASATKYDTYEKKQIFGIVLGVEVRHVAGYRGQAQQFDLGMCMCQKNSNGIVNTGITVINYGDLSHSRSPLNFENYSKVIVSFYRFAGNRKAPFRVPFL